jgi:hypothetical protein
MSRRYLSWFLSSAAVLGAACGGSSGETPTDATGHGAACESNDDCDAHAPICASSGTCVECESSEQCPAERPVCSNTTCTESCAGSEVAADFVALPSDIIWVVDQSGSMNQETQYVQAKINDFAMQIAQSNIDYRVVMIADPSGSNRICVPPPLGGPNCGNNTNFRLVNQRVGSTNGPSLAISRYSMYSDFLRPEAMKHFVFVTDDNSSMSAANFLSGLQGLQPAGMFDNLKIHAIYAYGNGTNRGCTGPFGSGAAEGTVYTQLVTQTGGARGVICEDDWTQVFTDITAAVVAGSQVSCELTIPQPPEGQTLDPSKVNVKYEMGGVAPGQLLPQVTSEADCGSSGGWYYDDPTAPTTVTLCPATCETVQDDDAANVKIEFGCSTQIF